MYNCAAYLGNLFLQLFELLGLLGLPFLCAGSVVVSMISGAAYNTDFACVFALIVAIQTFINALDVGNTPQLVEALLIDLLAGGWVYERATPNATVRTW